MEAEIVMINDFNMKEDYTPLFIVVLDDHDDQKKDYHVMAAYAG